MNKKGFTLVELMVTMIIIAILAAIAIPAGLGFIDQKRVDECATNRKTIISYYNAQLIKNPDLTLTDFMTAFNEKKISGADPDKLKCPSGGTYEVDAVNTNKLTCTMHDDEKDQNTEAIGGGLTTPALQPSQTPLSQ